MTLINCPECGVLVSDKAFQCPKCAYPINSNFIHKQTNQIKQTNENTQQTDVNLKKNLLLLTNRKSEGVAILLVLIFGPLGLFYASSKRATNLVIIMLITIFIINLITDYKEDSNLTLFTLIGIVFWIISIAQASKAVKEFNNSLLETSSFEKEEEKEEEKEKEIIEHLHSLIKKEKNLPFYAPSNKEDIISILEHLCENEESANQLINEYNNRYFQYLINDLSKLSTSKQTISEYLAPFEKYNIVDKDYNN